MTDRAADHLVRDAGCARKPLKWMAGLAARVQPAPMGRAGPPAPLTVDRPDRVRFDRRSMEDFVAAKAWLSRMRSGQG
jgi:hypothetical protein